MDAFCDAAKFAWQFIVTSKTMYIYIFDKNGLENSYYAGKYLLGTPAIGQVDSDPYLEIVIGGFGPGSTSENELFVINHDATDVSGFPFIVGEKIKAGVALADLNQNDLGINGPKKPDFLHFTVKRLRSLLWMH